MQRDLWSAFLARWSDGTTLHVDQARESWPATEPLPLMAWGDAQAARSPEAGNRHGGTQAGRPRVERLVSETGVWAPS